MSAIKRRRLLSGCLMLMAIVVVVADDLKLTTVAAKDDTRSDAHVDLPLHDSAKTSGKERKSKNDGYTSGLTAEFRSLLAAPSSAENKQQPRRRRPAKEPRRVVDEPDEPLAAATLAAKNEIAGLSQAHLEQMLKYYGRIANRLLPPSRFRKLTLSDRENVEKNSDDGGGANISGTGSGVGSSSNGDAGGDSEAKSAAEAPQPWLTDALPKQMPNEHAAAIAANAAAIAANAAALAAAPPSGLLLPASAYANGDYDMSAVNCGGGDPRAMAINGGGCNEYGYMPEEDIDTNYATDSLFGGGYGSQSHSGGGYSSSIKAPSYYQVSSPISSSHMSAVNCGRGSGCNEYGYSPKDDSDTPKANIALGHLLGGGVFGSSPMHHYGAHPTVSNYQQLLNSFAQRLGTDSLDGSGSAMFGPMHDPAIAGPIGGSIDATSPPPSVVIIAPSTDAPTAEAVSRSTDAPAARHHSSFHIVKPNFAAIQKKAKRVKTVTTALVVTTPSSSSTTTKDVNATTRSSSSTLSSSARVTKTRLSTTTSRASTIVIDAAAPTVNVTTTTSSMSLKLPSTTKASKS